MEVGMGKQKNTPVGYCTILEGCKLVMGIKF